MQTKSFSIGIDIGGTNTTFGMVNTRGEILNQGRIHTRDYPTPDVFVTMLKDTIMPWIEESGKDKFSGIGVGAPNANYYTGEIALAPNLPWKGRIPLQRLLEKAFDLPVTITNDAKATAIGEMTYGAAKGMKDFIMVTLGTGVGSGFVANGQLIYGHDGFAGELGHTIMVRGGRLCGCGRNGCLETYSSATGIVRTAVEWLTTRPAPEKTLPPQWLYAVYQTTGKVSSSEIHTAALAGDPLAIEIFDFTGKVLGQALANMVAITSPQAIFFFGGLAKAGDFLLKPTKKYMEDNLLAIYKNKIELIPSGLSKKDAAILGSSALAWG